MDNTLNDLLPENETVSFIITEEGTLEKITVEDSTNINDTEGNLNLVK